MTEILDFGRLSDFVRSAALARVTAYFQSPHVRSIIAETPNIEKYEISDQPEDQRFVSSVHIQRYFANLFEKLPLIAITTVSSSRFQMNIGKPLINDGYVGSLVGSVPEPFDLDDGDYIDLEIGGIPYSVWFSADMFTDIDVVTIQELHDLFLQLLPFVSAYDGGSGVIALSDVYNRPIIVVDGTAVSKLGLTVGQGTASKRSQSLGISERMSLSIDVVTQDRNQRTELADVLSTLFGFYLFDHDLGQWVYPKNSIIFRGEMTRRGESEVALENAPISKLYLDSIDVPLIAFASVERMEEIEDLTISAEQNIL